MVYMLLITQFGESCASVAGTKTNIQVTLHERLKSPVQEFVEAKIKKAAKFSITGHSGIGSIKKGW